MSVPVHLTAPLPVGIASGWTEPVAEGLPVAPDSAPSNDPTPFAALLAVLQASALMASTAVPDAAPDAPAALSPQARSETGAAAWPALIPGPGPTAPAPSGVPLDAAALVPPDDLAATPVIPPDAAPLGARPVPAPPVPSPVPSLIPAAWPAPPSGAGVPDPPAMGPAGSDPVEGTVAAPPAPTPAPTPTPAPAGSAGPPTVPGAVEIRAETAREEHPQAPARLASPVQEARAVVPASEALPPAGDQSVAVGTPVATPNRTERAAAEGSPLPPERLVAQIARATRRAEPGRYTLATALEPRHLGRVKVEIEVAAGSLRAHFTVSNAGALEALGAQQAQLRSLIAETGLVLAEFQVAMAGGGGEGQRRRQGDPGGASPSAPEPPRLATRTPSAGRRAAGAIDYLA